MIKKDNIRISVTISRSLNKILKEEADYQGRTVSNLVLHIVKHYIKHRKNISLD